MVASVLSVGCQPCLRIPHREWPGGDASVTCHASPGAPVDRPRHSCPVCPRLSHIRAGCVTGTERGRHYLHVHIAQCTLCDQTSMYLRALLIGVRIPSHPPSVSRRHSVQHHRRPSPEVAVGRRGWAGTVFISWPLDTRSHIAGVTHHGRQDTITVSPARRGGRTLGEEQTRGEVMGERLRREGGAVDETGRELRGV